MQRANDLLERTKQFALATINFCEQLPKDKTSRVLGRQLLRLGTSVGANYRASSIPLTVVVGRDGNVVRVMVGLHDAEDLEDVLREAGIL